MTLPTPRWAIHDSFESAFGYAAPVAGLGGWWAVPDDPERDGSSVGPEPTLTDLLGTLAALASTKGG